MEEIQSEFADLDLEITDEDVLAELAALCNRYNVDATKISCEYFSFTTSKKHGADGKLLAGQPPTMDSLARFETDKLKNLKPAGQRKPLDPIEGASNLPDCKELATGNNTPVKLLNKRLVTSPESQQAKRLVTALGTPGIIGGAQSQPCSPAVTVSIKYAERANRGEVLLRHKTESLDSATGTINSKAVISLPEGQLAKPYKFMYERLRDRAAVLDETICKVGERLLKGLARENEALLDPTGTNPEPGLVIGRIQCDGEGRLNSNSVVLHGSMDTCGGAVVPVDLSQVSQFSLFPGQIVAMEASNPNGSRLVGHTVHPGQPSGPQTPGNLSKGEKVSILTASGPFTLSDSASLDPLNDFLTQVATEKPSLAVIFGPFVDVKNSHVLESELNFEAQWEGVVARIAEQTNGLDTEVVLVPSGRDAMCLSVYPQPPLALPGTTSPRPNLRCVSDPSIITVSGVSIGLSSTDILFHLGKEEISFPPRSGDRMARLASHLVTQGSFYPLYPASEEVNIDYEQLELKAAIHSVPHLLLLPSDLSHFVREVSGCTVVNPGRVTKGLGPGTWARINLTAGQEEPHTGIQAGVEVLRI